jgi:hypothetical protein
MWVESNKKAKGGGWIHQLDKPLPEVEPREFKPKSKIDANRKSVQMFENPNAPIKRKWLSEQIGVSEKSLELLSVGVGWDKNGREYASFPSRNGRGQICGITRRYDNGEKKTYYGTSNGGIFCVPNWWTFSETVYIVEGGTDVAAMTDAGLASLGRPSNVGGISVLAEFLRRHRPARIVVIGEHDQKLEKRGTVNQCPPNCTGCAFCYPGKFGMIETAKGLSQRLRTTITTKMPPAEFKDVRQWWRGNQLKGL